MISCPQKNEQVMWHRTMQGGYGYVERIPGVVVAVGNKRVQIEVTLKSGETTRRWVSKENLYKPTTGASILNVVNFEAIK